MVVCALFIKDSAAIVTIKLYTFYVNPPLRSARVALLNSFYGDYMLRSADVKVCRSVHFDAEWAQEIQKEVSYLHTPVK